MFSFAGVSDIDQAEKLRGWLVTVSREQLHPLNDGQFYLFQLEGCRVFTDSGEELGVVEDILQMPAQDVLVVKGGKKEYLIPFLKRLFPKMEVAEKKLYVLKDGSW